VYELLVILTGLTIGVAALIAYYQSRDPLSPMVVISPILFYAYVYRPFVLGQSGEIFQIFGNSGRLEFVLLFNLVGVAGFCVGAQWYRLPRMHRRGRQWPTLNNAAKRRMRALGMMLGAIAIFVIVSMLWATGPSAFTMRKPYLISPIRSGYYRELINLSFPALLLVALGWSNTRLTLQKFITLIVIISPILYFATFGGRRGPLFLSFASLGVAIFIIRQRMPKVITILAGVSTLGLLMILLQVNRSNLFRFWENEIQTEMLVNSLHGTNLTTGDEFVSGVATVLASCDYQRNYWGARYAVMYLIRPIPRQFWPTKYADCGMRWMSDAPGSNGFTPSEWYQCVRFIPSGGSSGGFLSDLFLEFQFFAVFVAFLIGLVFNILWWRSIVIGGLWNILYFESLTLSVYLPVQSVGAWLYRLLLLVVPTVFVWNLYIKRKLRTSHQTNLVPPANSKSPSHEWFYSRQ